MKQETNQTLIVRGIIIIILYALLLNLPYIHLREFQGEEGRRVLISLNMLTSGDWVVPYIEGAVYLKKPPLFNWLLSIMFNITGNVSEATARMISVISSFLSAIALSLIWKKIAGIKSIYYILPGLIFLTLPVVLEKSWQTEIDITFTLFITLSLLSWFYLYEVKKKHTMAWAAGLFFAGLSLLTKGVQAPFFFYGTVIPYLVYKREARKIISLSHLTGISIFLAIVLSWCIPLIHKTGLSRFVDVWLFEILTRKETANEGNYIQSIITFPFSYIFAHLPWTPFLLLWRYKPLRDKDIMLKNIATFSLISLLFSVPFYWFIPGIRLRYLLPVSGMLVMLIAIPLTAMIENKIKEPASLNIYFKFVASSFILLIISVPVWGGRFKLFESTLPILFLGMSLITAVFLLIEKRFKLKLIALIVVILLIKLSYASIYLPYHSKYESPYRKAAGEINRLAPPDAIIYDYGVNQSNITFYLNRPVVLIKSADEGIFKNGDIILIEKRNSKEMNIKGFVRTGEVTARFNHIEIYRLEKDN